MKRMLVLLVATFFLTEVGIAAELELKMGSLKKTGPYATQVVSLNNSTGRQIKRIKLECGFYSGEELIAASTGFMENLDHGTTGHAEIIAMDAANADRGQCRIVEAE